MIDDIYMMRCILFNFMFLMCRIWILKFVNITQQKKGKK